MDIKQASDRNAFLSALISAGIIGGGVSLIEGNFEKSKYIFPIAIGVSLLTDYQVNKYRNHIDIEVVKDYMKKEMPKAYERVYGPHLRVSPGQPIPTTYARRNNYMGRRS